MNQTYNIAILDFYNGYPNEGMRCIKSLINSSFSELGINGQYEVFDIRGNAEIPKIEKFDAFISTGGPGSPVLENAEWEKSFGQFLDDLIAYNKENDLKKHLLLICHSYQFMVQYFHLGVVCKRMSTSFGVMTVHKTEAGLKDPLFDKLEDPFWAVDSRDYQVIQPNEDYLNKLGAEVLFLEKIRPHIPLERAVMGIRLTDEILGLQFHPEADSEGMSRYFLQEDKRMAVIAEHGEEKLETMLEQLEDEDKIKLTESVIIPGFLKNAIQSVQSAAIC